MVVLEYTFMMIDKELPTWYLEIRFFILTENNGGFLIIFSSSLNEEEKENRERQLRNRRKQINISFLFPIMWW